MNVTPSQREFAQAHRTRLDTFWPSQPKPPTREQFALAWEIIDGMKSLPTVSQIQSAVCRHFDVPLLYMSSARRHHDVYLPRAAAIYLCKNITGRTYSSIGRYFGGRDHTTIRGCCLEVEKMIALKHPIARDIEILSERLGGRL